MKNRQGEEQCMVADCEGFLTASPLNTTWKRKFKISFTAKRHNISLHMQYYHDHLHI